MKLRYLTISAVLLGVFGFVAFFSPALKATTETAGIRSEQNTPNVLITYGSLRNLLTQDPSFTKLTSEKCSREEAGPNHHSVSCLKTYANGMSLHTNHQYESFGNELKHQAIFTEFDSGKRTLHKKTVRQKVVYAVAEDPMKKTKQSEFFDIVDRPTQGKILRNVLLYEYDPLTSKPTVISWITYRQVGMSPFAAIENYVYLSYDKEGTPARGKIEKWTDGIPTETLFDWSLAADGAGRLDSQTWSQWEILVARFLTDAKAI